MILYHGSNLIVAHIDLSRTRPYKDFGQGFYLTDLKEQAQRMAERTARIYGGSPAVTAYTCSLDEARETGLKIKVFERPDRE